MLKYIKVQKCPKCGSAPTVERLSENTHVNGHKWETRSFGCGISVEHVPNFIDRYGNHEKITGECTRNVEYKEKHQKRKVMSESIRNLINDMEPKDSSFVERINRELNFLCGEGYVS